MSPLVLSSLRSARARALPVVLATAVAVVVSGLAAAPASADERRVALPGARPAVSASAISHTAVPVGIGEQVEVEVVFDLQDQAGAEAYATAVSTPGSAQYRQFLAPADWIARFAPTQATVDAFVTVAQQHGLTVKSMPASRLFVIMTGPDAQVEQLFQTDLRVFTVGGQPLVAPVGSVSLPASAAVGVKAAQFGRLPMTSRAVPAASAKSTPVRCSTWWKQRTMRIPLLHGTRTAPTALCGYTAAQLRAASDVTTPGLDGTGQTIAVIDAFGSSTIAADLATWSRRNGLPAAAYSQLLPARSTWQTSSTCSPSGWKDEQTLDLEAAHAIAPGASLVYVGAADCVFGFDTAMSQVLDQGLASIVSNSYGLTGGDTYGDPSGTTVALGLHQQLQAAAQGIGLYYASGDSGDNSVVYGDASVDFPASSPWVTAVGGTTTALDKRDRVVFRTAWGDRIHAAHTGSTRWSVKNLFTGGAGGGASSLFARPAYQVGAVPVSVSRGMRTSTDVSALAAPITGLAVGMTSGGRYSTRSIGGTSLATPIVAGQMALAQQLAGGPLGFANPALYAARSSVQDVAPSTTPRFAAVQVKGGVGVVTFDQDSSLRTRRGYDVPTGLGVLTAASLTAIAASPAAVPAG